MTSSDFIAFLNMAESAILDAIHAAATFLGYSQLRKPQESAVKHFLLGRDVFVTLPTAIHVLVQSSPQQCLVHDHVYPLLA